MPNLYDRVFETSSTTGTGSISLLGQRTGYQSFLSVISVGNQSYYCIENPNTDQWEVGIGIVSTTGVTRSSIISSSSGNSLVNFSSGTKNVFLPLSASVAVYTGGSYSNPAFITSLAESKVLPSQTGSAGKYLTTDGVNSSWGTIISGGTPGGSSGHVQFNDSGSFGGDSGLTYDKNTDTLSVGSLNTSTAISTTGTFANTWVATSLITGNQNNYAPTPGRNYEISADGDATRSITGLSIGQADGQEVTMVNVGTFDIVFKHQDSNSTAANRFLCVGGVDITIAANERIDMIYRVGTLNRWRVW